MFCMQLISFVPSQSWITCSRYQVATNNLPLTKQDILFLFKWKEKCYFLLEWKAISIWGEKKAIFRCYCAFSSGLNEEWKRRPWTKLIIPQESGAKQSWRLVNITVVQAFARSQSYLEGTMTISLSTIICLCGINTGSRSYCTRCADDSGSSRR